MHNPLRSISKKQAFITAGLLLALLVAGRSVAFARMMAPPPSNLDLSTQLPTMEQHFVVSYTPSVNPPPINQLHTWTVRVTTPDGQPVEGATIGVDGDMPQHGHGLPTRPQVTRSLGDGQYLVEGMKFQMGGWWVADFTVTDPAGQTDSVRFNFILG
jgi:YtkA-like